MYYDYSYQLPICIIFFLQLDLIFNTDYYMLALDTVFIRVAHEYINVLLATLVEVPTAYNLLLLPLDNVILIYFSFVHIKYS